MATVSTITFVFQGKNQDKTRKEQRSIINRHISQVSHRKRTEQSLKRLACRASRQGQDTDQTEEQAAHSRVQTPPSPDEIFPAASPSSLSSTSNKALPANRSEDRLLRLQAREALPSSHDAVSPIGSILPCQPNPTALPNLAEFSGGGLRRDPFRTMPITVSHTQKESTEFAMDYYVQVMAPAYEPVLLVLSLNNPMMVWLFPLMLHNADTFHAALAVTLTHIEKRRNPRLPPSRAVTYHRGKAMIELRKRLLRLEGAPDDAAIATVMSLACLEMLYCETSTNNRKGLGMMVALRGGLDNLGSDGVVKGLLVQLDYFWVVEGVASVFHMSKPKQRSSYPSHPFPPDLCALVATLPRGFEAIACRKWLRQDVLQILNRVAQFTSPHTTRSSKAGVADNRGRCPDIFEVCSCLQSSIHFNLEKGICLAVILFSFNVHWLTDRVPTYTQYRASRGELTKHLASLEPRTAEERDCILWIWIVVLDSWRAPAGIEQEGLDLSSKIMENFVVPSSWNRFEIVLRQFFWHDALATSWKGSFETAVGHFKVTMSQKHSLGSPFEPRDNWTRASDAETGDLNLRAGNNSSLASEFNNYSSHPSRTREISPPTRAFQPMLTLELYMDELDRDSMVELPFRKHDQR